MGRYNLTRLFKEPKMVTSKTFRARDLHEIASSLAPHTVGFNSIFDQLHRVSMTENQYPPYNIVDRGDEKYTIELALAGFDENELQVTQLPDNNELVVEGKNEDPDKKYLHKGIASRNFKRSFALSQDVQVTGALMVQGVLSIHLERIVPEERKPRKIEIGLNDKQFLQD